MVGARDVTYNKWSVATQATHSGAVRQQGPAPATLKLFIHKCPQEGLHHFAGVMRLAWHSLTSESLPIRRGRSGVCGQKS